jgi:deoxyribonuclease V
MIVALDVQYGVTAVTTAVVGWHAWPAAAAALERVERHASPPAPYVPGAFVERELPYLLAALAGVTASIDTIVIDGHVWLGVDRKGLGAHLHDHTRLRIIGVAKNAFVGAPSLPVIRGDSARPLHITAAGTDPAAAAAAIASMHGPYRLPTLLKRADSLARTR